MTEDERAAFRKELAARLDEQLALRQARRERQAQERYDFALARSHGLTARHMAKLRRKLREAE